MGWEDQWVCGTDEDFLRPMDILGDDPEIRKGRQSLLGESITERMASAAQKKNIGLQKGNGRMLTPLRIKRDPEKGQVPLREAREAMSSGYFSSGRNIW